MPTNSSQRSKRSLKPSHGRPRTRPFWLPAISYYVLAGAISAACFFIVWGVIFEGGEEAPWITAGIAASLCLIASVFVREVVLRNARNRYLADRRRLDRNFINWSQSSSDKEAPRKLSLRQNEMMLARIAKMSEAARVLSDLSEGHREVFDICDDYLRITGNELRRTDVKSPRFVAIRKGRSRVKKLHQHHFLSWAEIESKEMLRGAGSAGSSDEKIETAGNALEVLESAIRRYPSESRLLDSAQALREFMSAVRISELISEAEKEEADGNLGKAMGQYEGILELLPEEHFAEGERMLLSERLFGKLADLRARDADGI